jgi:nucleotide-binding universal stress UspA family protein
MTTEESAPPVLATFSVDSPRREPVYFGLLASRVIGAPLVAVTVRRYGPMVDVMRGDVEYAPGEDRRAVEHVRTELKRRGVRRPDVRVIGARRVGAGLAQAIRDIRPRLVVLGSPRHRGAGGKLLGDTVETVIHETEVPVVVVPEGHETREGGVDVVGVAFAPTEEGRAALQTAAALARAASARLRAIEVIDEARGGEAPATSPELHEALSQLDIDAAAESVSGDPVESLVAATSAVDLLVMGSRARGARRAVMLGSVSRKVAEEAACPVLIVPRAAIGAAGALFSVPMPETAS